MVGSYLNGSEVPFLSLPLALKGGTPTLLDLCQIPQSEMSVDIGRKDQEAGIAPLNLHGCSCWEIGGGGDDLIRRLLLAEGFVEDDGHGGCEVEAAGAAGFHRDAQ